MYNVLFLNINMNLPSKETLPLDIYLRQQSISENISFKDFFY